MSPRILASTIGRILGQLRHDRRTIAMIIVVPAALITLRYFMFAGQERIFDRIALIMLGVFPFIIMFLITSIAMLRERTNGTLERLFTTPVGKLDLLFAYGFAFGAAAAVPAAVDSGIAFWVFDMQVAGSIGLVILIAVANAVLGVALGLLCSAFARTEFRAVQFMPVVAVPLSYSVEALTQVGAHADPTGRMWRDLAIVIGAVVLALALGAATLRRRTG